MKHAAPGLPAVGIAILAVVAALTVAVATSPAGHLSVPQPAPGPVVAPNVHGGAR